MSVEALGWVFARSPMKGAAFAVHLAVADSVNDVHENEFWMRTPKLAKKARLSRGTTDKALAALCAAGLLELLEEGKPGPRSSGAPRRFLFLMPDLPVAYESRAERARLPKVSRRTRETSRAEDATLGLDTSLLLSQEEENPKKKNPSAVVGTDLGFVEFWSSYPKRNGKRENRGKALEVWKRLGYDDRKAAWRGAQHYRAACESGLTIAADAFRWLRDRRWGDWQEPATPTTNGNRGMLDVISEAGAAEVMRQYEEANGSNEGPRPVSGRALPSGP